MKPSSSKAPLTNVVIRGDGVAARCCAHLLEGPGFRIAAEVAPRATLPAIMISEATQALFCDVFGQPGLFEGLNRVTRRVVAWPFGAGARVLAHSAVVVAEQTLLERLRSLPSGGGALEISEAGWTIVASRPLPRSSAEKHFGDRIARAIAVTLADGADRSACYVESLDDGWLFLLPESATTGWLLAVGGESESLLDRSRLLGGQLAEVRSVGAEFRAYPRIAWPLCGPAWLACGTGALAFDPLCGDGSGNAVREAILAAAVVRAVARGGNPDELLAHYRTRLLAGFHRHLQVCRQYYLGGGSSAWWAEQLEWLHKGLAWCETELASAPAARYQLRGFDVQRIG